MVAWKNIHLATFRSVIFFARYKEEKGKQVLINKSDDRTEEVARALMQSMRVRVSRGDKDKPFFGYRDEEGGQLVYIKPGWTFEYRRLGVRKDRK